MAVPWVVTGVVDSGVESVIACALIASHAVSTLARLDIRGNGSLPLAVVIHHDTSDRIRVRM